MIVKNSEPETRPSFLRRMVSDSDPGAWKRFDEIYSPMIYQYARKKGLQEADALEITQDVLLQVYKYLPSFEYDSNRGRFRAWLQTVTKNRLSRYWKNEARRQETTGRNTDLDLREADDFFESRFVRQVTQQAMDEIRKSFHEDTWNAFQITWVEQKDAAIAAAKLERPVGWVYVARSRVLKKLTERVSAHFEDLRQH